MLCLIKDLCSTILYSDVPLPFVILIMLLAIGISVLVKHGISNEEYLCGFMSCSIGFLFSAFCCSLIGIPNALLFFIGLILPFLWWAFAGLMPNENIFAK